MRPESSRVFEVETGMPGTRCADSTAVESGGTSQDWWAMTRTRWRMCFRKPCWPLPGLAEDTRLWACLARIGHNQASLYWRKRYRDQGTSFDADLLTDGSENTPIETLTRLETVAAIRHLLAQLSSEQVAILTAKYLDGLSVAEIVSAMGGDYRIRSLASCPCSSGIP